MPPLKWGLAGVGMIAHDFLTALDTLPPEQHKVTAVAGIDLERAHKLASLHKVPVVYENYETLARDKAVDIVFVSVINSQHFEISKLMLEHGKHVICEKPLGINHKQTKTLVELAKDKRLFLVEAMWSRFFPAYEALEQHISSGGLGELYHINIQFGVEINDIERNLMKDLSGGAVLDLGIHMIQLLQFLYKSPPIDLVCTGHISSAGVDESFSCALKHAGGKTSTICAHTRVTLCNRAEIIGTSGSILLDYFWCPTRLHISAANNTEWTLPKARYTFHFHNSAGLVYLIQECRDRILEGALESPKMSWDDSILISKLMETMREQLGLLENGF